MKKGDKKKYANLVNLKTVNWQGAARVRFFSSLLLQLNFDLA